MEPFEQQGYSFVNGDMIHLLTQHWVEWCCLTAPHASLRLTLAVL